MIAVRTAIIDYHSGPDSTQRETVEPNALMAICLRSSTHFSKPRKELVRLNGFRITIIHERLDIKWVLDLDGLSFQRCYVTRTSRCLCAARCGVKLLSFRVTSSSSGTIFPSNTVYSMSHASWVKRKGGKERDADGRRSHHRHQAGEGTVRWRMTIGQNVGTG